MADTTDGQPSADDVLDAVAQTSYGELLHDDQRRRHELYKLMADSTDPMVREMGEQLRDGLVTPLQLLSVPEYAEALMSGVQRLAEFDMKQVVEEMDAIRGRERGH